MADRRFRILANELGVIRQAQLSMFLDLSGQMQEIGKNFRLPPQSFDTSTSPQVTAPSSSILDVEDDQVGPEGRRILRRMQALAVTPGEGHV